MVDTFGHHKGTKAQTFIVFGFVSLRLRVLVVKNFDNRNSGLFRCLSLPGKRFVEVFRSPLMKKLLLAVSILALMTVTAMAQDAPPPPVLKMARPQIVEPSPTPTPDEKEPEIDEDDVVKVSTSLITIPAEVVDRSGRYAANLRKEDFHIYENGVEQQLSYFASVEEPFTVALLLDVSGSTQSQLQAIRTAANTFISRLRRNDKLLIIAFDGKMNIMTEAVTFAELRQKKMRLDALNDGTLLYDTVGFTLNQRLAAIKGRKAIVLLTDGVDYGSKRWSLKQNLRDAEESDVMIYPVHYNTLPQLPERLSRVTDPKQREKMQSKLTKEYAVGSTYLKAMADKTGGRMYETDNLVDVPRAFSMITEELGRKYSLGYYPKGQVKQGETRTIKVRVNNFVVRAKDSYVAGNQNSSPQVAPTLK
jgi:Ca-activated chloride channel family protein